MSLREALNKIKQKYTGVDTSVPLKDRLQQTVEFGVPQAKKEPWLVDEGSAQETPEMHSGKDNPLQVIKDGAVAAKNAIAPKVSEAVSRVAYSLSDEVEYVANEANVASAPATAEAPVAEQAKPESAYDREKIRTGIVYNENRGAISAGKDPYKSVGPTGDLGKYQTSPATLDGWSKPWLGKKVTPDEFLADPEMQEKYFEEFLNVAEKYNLTPREAAIAWHRGWGELGAGPRETREKRFRESIERNSSDEIGKAYLSSFEEGTTTSDGQ